MNLGRWARSSSCYFWKFVMVRCRGWEVLALLHSVFRSSSQSPVIDQHLVHSTDLDTQGPSDAPWTLRGAWTVKDFVTWLFRLQHCHCQRTIFTVHLCSFTAPGRKNKQNKKQKWKKKTKSLQCFGKFDILNRWFIISVLISTKTTLVLFAQLGLFSL